MGVDLFFAVSGFVIARQLLQTTLRSEATTTPELVASLRAFYRRRAFRLIPNALTLSVSIVVLSAIEPSVFGDLARNLKNALAGLAGIGNWYAVRYPDITTGEIRPLIHMWSLSIEEQFYLVLPPLLLFSRRHAKAVASLFGSVAVMVSIWASTTTQSASTAFFSTWSRVAPIGLGVLLAVAFSNPDTQWRLRKWRGQTPALHLLLSTLFGFAVFVHWSDDSLRSGGFVASAVMCAGIVALSAVGIPSFVGGALRSAPFQLLGERSYALYLWHFPVAYLFLGLGRAPQLILRILLSAALTEISFRLIEQPGRRTLRWPKAHLAPLVMGALSLFLVVAETRSHA